MSASMASEAGVEKDDPGGESRTDSTYHSDIEKAEPKPDTVKQCVMEGPDLDCEKVEQTGPDHRDDLIREHVGSLFSSQTHLF
jgi:hypothetical protein